MRGNVGHPKKCKISSKKAKEAALCRWLLFAGSVVGVINQSYVYSILVPSTPMCYQPNIYDTEGFFTLTNKSIMYQENMKH